LYWLDIGTGFVLYGLIAAITPVIVIFYHEPRLTGMVLLAGLSFLIMPIGQQFRSLLQKELEFRTLALVEILAAFSATTVAIITAVLGAGAYAFVWGLLSSTICSALLFGFIGWRRWRPRIHFRSAELKGYLSFGLYQMGERSVNYFTANVDYLVIGRYLGPEVLGIYMLAYRLVIFPLTTINPIINKVAFPVLARKQTDDGSLRKGYLEMSKIIAFVMFPLLALMAATAPLFVPLVFGSKWLPAVLLVQILALLGMLKSLSNPSGSMLLAKGRADIGFKWNLFVIIINATVFVYVVRFGVYALAWTYVGLSFVYFFILMWILKRVIGLKLSEFLLAISRPAIISLTTGLLVYGFYVALDVGGAIMLAAMVLLGASIYILLALLFERHFLRDSLILFFNRSG
jgi:O-antigen/teichoic acid export membrane protein